MKRNTSHTIKRAQRFPVILIGEGLLVGAVGGLIVLLYRIALTCAGKWLGEALAFIKGNPLRIAGHFQTDIHKHHFPSFPAMLRLSSLFPLEMSAQ